MLSCVIYGAYENIRWQRLSFFVNLHLPVEVRRRDLASTTVFAEIQSQQECFVGTDGAIYEL